MINELWHLEVLGGGAGLTVLVCTGLEAGEVYFSTTKVSVYQAVNS